MERLTLVEMGETLIKDGFNKKDTGGHTSICYGCINISGCVNKCGFYKAFKKLAEYEDTGLTPNQIYELAKANYKHQEKIEELEEDCDYWKLLEM